MSENENLNGSIDLISSDGTRTTENGKNLNHSDTAAVAEVLLSFMKDGRYLKSLVHLLSQALAPWLIDITRQRNTATNVTTNQNEDVDIMGENTLNTNNRWMSVVKPELELLAGIIYFVFTIWSRGRTLGMEYVGIEYFFCDRNNKSGSNLETKKIFSRFNNQKYKNIHQTKEDSYFLQSMGNSRLRMMAFSFVYVFVPYLIRRVGKENGWSKLNQLLNLLFHRRGEQGYLSDLHERDETLSHINESLRGIARRRVYENQRRAMLERIERMERQAQEQTEGIDQEQNQVDESNSNRNMDEAQLSMISSIHLNLNQLRNYTFKHRLGLFLRKAQHLLRVMFQHLSIIEEQELRASTNTQTLSIPVTTENDDVQRLNSSHSTVYNRYTSSLYWFLRLHLALYFLNSRYPTFLSHRLLSIKMRSGGAPFSQASSSSSSQTYHNPIIRPSYRLLGLLLVVQSFAGLLKGGTNICMNALYRMQIYNNIRMRRRLQRQRENDDQNHIEELTQNEEGDSFLASVERIVPSSNSSIHASSDHSIMYSSDFVRSIGDITNNSSSTTRICALCMSERKSPSIAPCGHVFCWKCIQHWCTNVRPECPLCRKPTLPQSVLALYGYR